MWSWKVYRGWFKGNNSGSAEDPQTNLRQDVFLTPSVFIDWRRCVFLSQHELLYVDFPLDNEPNAFSCAPLHSQGGSGSLIGWIIPDGSSP